MDCHENQTRATAQRLMEALKRFNRVAWHERSFMGFKQSEIRMLFCVVLLLNSGLFAYVGFLGGQIHHEEIRTPSTTTTTLKH